MNHVGGGGSRPLIFISVLLAGLRWVHGGDLNSGDGIMMVVFSKINGVNYTTFVSPFINAKAFRR